MNKKHSTHFACKEQLEKYGGKTKGCCCTGHKCKPLSSEHKSGVKLEESGVVGGASYADPGSYS